MAAQSSMQSRQFTTELARIVGIFTQPRSVFAEVKQQPRWLIPLLVLTVCSTVFTVTMNMHVGWDVLIRRELQMSRSGADLTSSQIEQYVRDQKPVWNYVTYIYGIFGSLIAALLISAVMFIVFIEAGVTFRKVFSLVLYSMLPAAVASLLGAMVVLLEYPQNVDPGRVLPSNLAFFSEQEQILSTWQLSLSQSIDLFSLWSVGLMALGFTVFSRDRSFLRCTLLTTATWMVLILVKALLFSSMSVML